MPETEIGATNCAIMFADVSGSSRLYKEVGNATAKRIIDQAVEMMCQLTLEHRGVVVKTIGDEVMARFAHPEDAVLAAIAMQRASKCLDAKESFNLRIGIDCGEVLIESGDVFGDTVNDAAYVSHVARGEQIVLTADVVETLSFSLRPLCHEFDRVILKGGDGKTTLYRMVWEIQEVTGHGSATRVMSLHDITERKDISPLHLSYLGQQITVGIEQTPFIVGRDSAKVSLHTNSGLASRDHCHIVYRRGKYVLADHSTNGTYVAPDGQSEIYLRREELPLTGKGSISIGQSCEKAGKDVISYTVN